MCANSEEYLPLHWLVPHQHTEMNNAMFKVQILISVDQLKKMIPQKSTVFVTLDEYK